MLYTCSIILYVKYISTNTEVEVLNFNEVQFTSLLLRESCFECCKSEISNSWSQRFSMFICRNCTVIGFTFSISFTWLNFSISHEVYMKAFPCLLPFSLSASLLLPPPPFFFFLSTLIFNHFRILFWNVSFYLFLRERERKREQGKGRERGRESQAVSTLLAQSPMWGSKLTNCEIMTCTKQNQQSDA